MFDPSDFPCPDCGSFNYYEDSSKSGSLLIRCKKCNERGQEWRNQEKWIKDSLYHIRVSLLVKHPFMDVIKDKQTKTWAWWTGSYPLKYPISVRKGFVRKEYAELDAYIDLIGIHNEEVVYRGENKND